MQFCVEQMQTVTFYGMLRNVSTNYEWKSHGFCVCVFSTFQQCGTVHVLEEASVQASLTSETGDFQENIYLKPLLNHLLVTTVLSVYIITKDCIHS